MRTLKQKKRNRLLAALLAVAMMFQMLPLMAFADEGPSSTEGTVKIGTNVYSSLREAVQSVPADGEVTIRLGAGTYTLYEGAGPNSSLVNPRVKIHLVGEGIDITTLEIGGPLSDSFSGEKCSDYSFGGADTVTFEDMTLTTRYQRDYQGFSHIKNETSVNRCKINGYTAYWGYQSATFTDTEFNPPLFQYALWTYCSPVMTFNRCTFNASGKVINVYTDYSAGSHDITVNFNDCTVDGFSGKQALNINDSNMGDFKYILNITKPHVTATRDDTTCSQVFGFGGKKKAETYNTGRTKVWIDDDLVWSMGKMRTHSYTDGKKEEAYDKTYSAWRDSEADRIQVQDEIRKCKYCGWEETSPKYASVYSLQYNLNGGTEAEGENYEEHLWRQDEEVPLAADPSREGYTFVGWKDAAGRTYSYPDKAETVLKLKRDTVLTAQWADLANDPILTVEGGTITAKKDGAELTLNIQEVGDTQKTTVPAGAEVTVELNKDAIPQNMNFDRWTLDGWTLDDETLKNELDAALNQETITFTMPTHDLSVEAVYQGTAGDSGDSSIIGTVLIATGATAIGYYAGTQVLKHCYGLPYWPGNRSALALMLWEDADRPMPVSTVLYPDVGQKERDMDLQHAARWAMENELIPDLNLDDSKPEEEQKFFPNYAVSRAWALHAWNKAQKLKKNA